MEQKIYFWDYEDCENTDKVKVELCHPQLREKIYTFDAPWEGNCTGYYNIVKWDGKYYMYYGSNSYPPYESEHPMHDITFCLLTSSDGIHFWPIQNDQYDFFGCRKNNIVFIGDKSTDNFTVMVDENPACPPEERFKAMVGGQEETETGRHVGTLDCYVSADGIHFTYKCRMPVKGNFDSQNTLIYDKERKKYILYSRKMSGTPDNPVWGGIRTIRVCYSDDFVNFTEPKTITYDPDYPFEMYTNGIRKYGDLFIGTPTRYTDRVEDREGIENLPDRKNRQYMIDRWGRVGTAMTDSLFMFSRDGENFHRFPEAFMTPGPEAARNWYYGDCYLSHGHTITKSRFDGAPDEISIFLSRNYRSEKPVELWRCTIRMDGFACIRSGYEKGTVRTKKIKLGNSILLNFATSCAGYIDCKVIADGKEVYKVPRIFGDKVDFSISLPDDVAGKEAQIEFEMCDAAIYSMTF